jgi:hypothetical protein
MCNIEAIRNLKDGRDKDRILENMKGLGVSLRSLGLTRKDIDNPKYMFDINCERFAKKDIVTLYRYTAYQTSGYGSSGVGENTRKFCRDLTKKTNVSLFTYQNILSVSPMKGMGQGGSNIYSVFKYRGGVHCKHIWVKYFFDSNTLKLIVAPEKDQPVQIGKGDLPNA